MHKNILTVVGITILFLGTCITPSIAQTQQKDSLMRDFSDLSMVMSPSGEIEYNIITTDCIPLSQNTRLGCNLKYYQNTLRSDGWNITLVDLHGNVGRGTSLALDSRDYPHISYFDRDTLSLKYANWTGSTWDIEIVDSPVAAFSSLVLDSNDFPRIAYMARSGERLWLRYAKWTGSGWSIEDVDTDGNTGWNVALALDSYDTPYMCYAVNEEPSFWDGDLRCAWLNESRWEIETVATFCWCDHSIAIDSNDTVAIAFSKCYSTPHGYDTRLTYAIKVLKGWAIYEVDPSEHQAGSISLAFDSRNRPHISYSAFYFPRLFLPYGDYILKYARLLSDNWEIYIVDDTKGQNGYKTSLAFDSDDRPFISYSYSIENSLFFRSYELRFAGFVDEGSEPYWITCLIDDGGDSYGFYSSLAFDSIDNPHISYYRNYNFGGLMYANRVGTFIVSIDEPERGYIYRLGKKIRPFFNGHTIVIGYVTVNVKANRKIQRVDFYLDDKFICSVHNEPFRWIWVYSAFLRHNIKIVATDFSGSIASDGNMVWKFF